MVRPFAGDLPEQVKNNQSVNMAAGNGGQKMSQYSWFTVYCENFCCGGLSGFRRVYLHSDTGGKEVNSISVGHMGINLKLLQYG